MQAAVGSQQELVTQTQLARLRYYAVRCAINYCPTGTFCVDGQEVSGVRLVRCCNDRWQAGKGLPSALLRHYYSTMINPISNRWLLEGGFITRPPKDHSCCYHNRLTKAAANYLILRFEKVVNELDHTTAQRLPMDQS